MPLSKRKPTENIDKQKEFSYAVVGCGMLIFIGFVLFLLIAKILF